MRLINSTNISEKFFITDKEGNRATTITSSTAGASAAYQRGNTAWVAIPMSDLAAIDAVHADGGFIYTGRPGIFRFDTPDAIYASGADHFEVDLQFDNFITTPVFEYLVDPGVYKANVSNLDVAVSTRSDGSVWTNTKAALLDAAISSRAATSALTTIDGNVDAIKAITDTLTLAAIADKVLDELITEHNVPNSLGKALTDLLAGGEASLSQATLDAIADTLLMRSWLAVTNNGAVDPSPYSVLNALRTIRNKISINGSTMSVFKEDEANVAWTANVSTSNAVDPITGIDPN